MLRGRPRRGALGLRGRIAGAVLVTTVATLAIAALVLLPRLEGALRNAARTTLQREVRGATVTFRSLDLRYVLDAESSARGSNGKYLDPAHDIGVRQRQRLARQQAGLGTRIGASVYLVGGFNVDGVGKVLAPPSDPDGLIAARFLDDVAVAFRTGKSVPSFASMGGTEYARVAIPVTIRNGTVEYVLAVRKPIDEIPAAVNAIRTAFLYAALAGLALTLILAIPLSGTVVKRLQLLREAALRLARGEPAVELPLDRARDEVGDLARTFALMQSQLQQQEEARRAFVATASHELRTPITSLEGMLELLEEDLKGGALDLDDALSLLERSRVQSRRLARLAADLLDLSRIDAQVQLRAEPVELGELSRAVLAEFELGLEAQGIISEFDDARGPVWALGDPGSVARIVRILLDNAIRLSPPGADVKIELTDGPMASLSVCDSGPGVPPEERELIFNRFQRGRAAAQQAGFGLGLAIGRELAARMGGQLVLDETHSPGAKFTLRLPVAHAPQEEPLVVG
jgi:signal transduction histidine kinase